MQTCPKCLLHYARMLDSTRYTIRDLDEAFEADTKDAVSAFQAACAVHEPERAELHRQRRARRDAAEEPLRSFLETQLKRSSVSWWDKVLMERAVIEVQQSIRDQSIKEYNQIESLYAQKTRAANDVFHAVTKAARTRRDTETKSRIAAREATLKALRDDYLSDPHFHG